MFTCSLSPEARDPGSANPAWRRFDAAPVQDSPRGGDPTCISDPVTQLSAPIGSGVDAEHVGQMTGTMTDIRVSRYGLN